MMLGWLARLGWRLIDGLSPQAHGRQFPFSGACGSVVRSHLWISRLLRLGSPGVSGCPPCLPAGIAALRPRCRLRSQMRPVDAVAWHPAGRMPGSSPLSAVGAACGAAGRCLTWRGPAAGSGCGLRSCRRVVPRRRQLHGPCRSTAEALGIADVRCHGRVIVLAGVLCARPGCNAARVILSGSNGLQSSRRVASPLSS